MTTTYARYEDWLRSVGNPEHHVVIGPDWWGCLCGEVEHYPDRNPSDRLWEHQRSFGGEAVQVDPSWHWGLVRDLPGTMADVHQDLWEQEAF